MQTYSFCIVEGGVIWYIYSIQRFSLHGRSTASLGKDGSSMVSRVFSAGLDGINGYIVTVECLLSGGLAAARCGRTADRRGQRGRRARARRREILLVRLACVAPDGQPRPGGHAQGRDRPRSAILLSILAAAGEINALPQDALFFGELSLSGDRVRCAARSPWRSRREARTSVRSTSRRPTRRRPLMPTV